MKTVKDLSREELDELKETYFWQLQDDDDEVLWAINNSDEKDIEGINDPSEIPDSVIINHYDGITFVEDDFFCNQTEE